MGNKCSHILKMKNMVVMNETIHVNEEYNKLNICVDRLYIYSLEVGDINDDVTSCFEGN